MMPTADMKLTYKELENINDLINKQHSDYVRVYLFQKQ